MLVDGKWAANWQPIQAKDGDGRFVRQTSSFRHWVTADGRPGPTGSGGFKAEAGRYHLYVALICPWASRVLMVRNLKKLHDVIDITVVEPFLTDQGWAFGTYRGADRDPLHKARHLHQIYTLADANFTGRATVPVLWDKHRNTIVNNESADLMRILNSAFDAFGDAGVDLFPGHLRSEIEALNTPLYAHLNNGVYKAGFASSQAAYDEAVSGVFATLAGLEQRLANGGPFLFGEPMTESDLRLFVTLIRFDIAYFGAFKCNILRLCDHPALQAYMERMLAVPAIRSTVNLDHIKAGYYSILALNPSGIVPAGPDLAPGWP